MDDELTPQEKGRAFEKFLSTEYNLHLVKGSGAGKWEKLDVQGSDLLISAKYTTKKSFSITEDLLQEAKDEAFGSGGLGIDQIPVVVTGFESGEITATIDFNDLIMLLEERQKNSPS